MTATLAIVIKKTKTNAESVLVNQRVPIEQRQIINILNYVLIHTNEYNIKVDSRLIKYEENIKEKKAAISSGDREKNIAFLQELLKSADWNLDIDDLDSNKKKGVDEKSHTKAQEKHIESKKLIKRKFFVSQKPYQLSLNGSQYEVTIYPINALPNINTISEKTLVNYLSYKGVSEKLAQVAAAAIKDWIDKDDFVRIGGAERGYYGVLSPVSYNPKNANIQSWQELDYIKSLTPEVINIIRKNFVFYEKVTPLSKLFLNNKELAILAGLTDKEFDDAVEYIAESHSEDILAPEHVLQYKKFISDESDDEKYIIINIHGSLISLRAIYNIQDKKLISFFYLGVAQEKLTQDQLVADEVVD